MIPAKRARKGRGGARAGAGRSSAPAVERLVGFHSVIEALRAQRRQLDRVEVAPGRARRELARILEAARAAGVPVVESSPGPSPTRPASEGGERRRPEEPNSQGVCLVAGPLPEISLAELVEIAGAGAPRIVALDEVEDPQNLGAVARVAEAAGAAGLLLPRRRSAPLSPAVSRASAGAIEWLPVARETNLVRALGQLKERGYWVVGAIPDARTPVFELPERSVAGPVVVLLGAEGRGIRPSVRDQVDHPVRIPMRGRVESLNVATAAAVLLYDLVRRSPVPPSSPVSSA